MVDMLKNPPATFEEVVREHFRLKRAHIHKAIAKWLREAQSSDTPGHYTELKQAYDTLVPLLDALGPSPCDQLPPSNEEELSPDESAAVDASVTSHAAPQPSSAQPTLSYGAPAFASPQQQDVEAAENQEMEEALAASLAMFAAQEQAATAAATTATASEENLLLLQEIFESMPKGLLRVALEKNSDAVDQACEWIASYGESHLAEHPELFVEE